MFERLLSRVLDKILSGRFMVAVFVIFTYCSAIHEVNTLVGSGKISVETYIAVLGAFGALATYIVKAYFDSSHDTKNAPVGEDPAKPEETKPIVEVKP